MNFEGILIGAVSVAMIGLFHPIVIKCEYYFSERIWPVFLVIGIVFICISVFTHGNLSIITALLGTSCFWSIKELREQTKRVKKGWFPENPNKKIRSDDIKK